MHKEDKAHVAEEALYLEKFKFESPENKQHQAEKKLGGTIV